MVAWLHKAADLALIGAAAKPNDLKSHPIPFMLDLIENGDEYVFYSGVSHNRARQRTYLVKDSSGNPWPPNAPIKIRERFGDRVGRGQLPAADGCWDRIVACVSGGQALEDDSSIKDFYSFPGIFGAEVGFIQYYYATDFIPPSILSNSGFTLPAITNQGLAVPLLIKDLYNGCKKALGQTFIYIPAQPIRLNQSFSGIDGDGGPGTGCAPASN